MLTDFSKIKTVQEFLEAAQNEAAAWPMSSSEFNVPANLITLADDAKRTGGHVPAGLILAEAEQGMLQIALLNQGLNPGSPFINTSHREGWRYRPHLGFYREDHHAH